MPQPTMVWEAMGGINPLPTPYLGRFMFGFRLKAKPEHEAAQVGRW